jgi:predicted Zn-dependent protease
LAVAERAQDYEFLVGDAQPPKEYNTVVIQHVRQGQLRFVDEPRFKLAQGIAEERHAPDIARREFEKLKNDVDLRGEAVARLGVMAVNERQDDRALGLFKEVDSLTRDPWVLYLARFSSAQIFTRKNRLADAEREYRRALEAIPHAQSGSVALATLLVRDGRRQEATEIVDAMLAAKPTPDDPWRTYGSGDDRFWPLLIAQLRAEIRR